MSIESNTRFQSNKSKSKSSNLGYGEKTPQEFKQEINDIGSFDMEEQRLTEKDGEIGNSQQRMTFDPSDQQRITFGPGERLSFSGSGPSEFKLYGTDVAPVTKNLKQKFDAPVVDICDDKIIEVENSSLSDDEALDLLDIESQRTKLDIQIC